MKTNKTLRNIVLASALALGSTGCGTDQSQYKYYGKIGEDQVTFKEAGDNNTNALIVKKPDGRLIKYIDYIENDLTLEYVEIIKDGRSTVYSSTKYSKEDEVGKTILAEAQKQFDEYLKQIRKIKQQDLQKTKQEKINEGLVDLK